MFQREIILAVSVIKLCSTPWCLLVQPPALHSEGLTTHVSQGPDQWVFDGWRWLLVEGRRGGLFVQGQTQKLKKSYG